MARIERRVSKTSGAVVRRAPVRRRGGSRARSLNAPASNGVVVTPAAPPVEAVAPAPPPSGAVRRLTTVHDSLLRPLKTAETVARDIVDEIVSKGMRTGDRLPTEAAMIKQYGVSRESLREGLRLLEVQGLVITRRGNRGGNFVGTADAANLGRISTLYYHFTGGTYLDLFEAQAVAEGVLAERAASNPHRAAVRAAIEAVTAAERALQDHTAADEDPAEYVHRHVNFHVVVAELANNPVLEMMMQTLTQIVGHHIAVVADPRDVKDEIEESHAAIAAAIVDGRAGDARELMERHSRAVAAFYSERMGHQVDDLIEWR